MTDIIAVRCDGCTCIYCQRGVAHPHEAERFVPIFGSPLKSVCRNCGHKVVFVDTASTKETP